MYVYPLRLPPPPSTCGRGAIMKAATVSEVTFAAGKAGKEGGKGASVYANLASLPFYGLPKSQLHKSKPTFRLTTI